MSEPGATGGGDPEKLSEEDKKLLAAFKGLHFKTDIKTTEDLISFMKKYSTVTKVKGEPSTTSTASGGDPVTVPATGGGPVAPAPGDPGPAASYHYPRLPSFNGKGETSWETFKFEIEALLTRVGAKSGFSEDQILQGVRIAAKGEVSDILRRLGPGARLADVIAKLDSCYGNIESKESILRKFYSCSQQKGQSVTAFASEIEEIFSQAVALGALRGSDTDCLKQVLHQGLHQELKRASAYKCETVVDYDKFKVELRKLESDMSQESSTKTCKAAVVNETQDNSEVMQMLRKINSRIDKLEADKNNSQRTQQFGPPQPFVPRPLRRGNTRGLHRGQPRGGYRPVRPTYTGTFSQPCYECGQIGHFARDCPKARSACYNCGQTGHFARNCPNA